MGRTYADTLDDQMAAAVLLRRDDADYKWLPGGMRMSERGAPARRPIPASPRGGVTPMADLVTFWTVFDEVEDGELAQHPDDVHVTRVYAHTAGVDNEMFCLRMDGIEDEVVLTPEEARDLIPILRAWTQSARYERETVTEEDAS